MPRRRRRRRRLAGGFPLAPLRPHRRPVNALWFRNPSPSASLAGKVVPWSPTCAVGLSTAWAPAGSLTRCGGGTQGAVTTSQMPLWEAWPVRDWDPWLQAVPGALPQRSGAGSSGVSAVGQAVQVGPPRNSQFLINCFL